MHMEVRVLRWCPLGVLYLVFEVLVSHWDLKLTDSAAEPQGSACLCSLALNLQEYPITCYQVNHHHPNPLVATF